MSTPLASLPATLQAFRQGQLSLPDLARTWRDAAQAHQPPLPQRYQDVLERVLNQLESASLFTEESCSFSQNDMVDALADWLSHAQRL